MTTKQCNNCCFGDVCNGAVVCDDYYPVAEDLINKMIEGYCELRREEYRQEWYDYLLDGGDLYI